MSEKDKDENKTFAQKLEAKEILRVEDVAEQTGWTPQHIRRMCKARKISHTRLGSGYYFTQENIDSLFHDVEAE